MSPHTCRARWSECVDLQVTKRPQNEAGPGTPVDNDAPAASAPAVVTGGKRKAGPSLFGKTLKLPKAGDKKVDSGDGVDANVPQTYVPQARVTWAGPCNFCFVQRGINILQHPEAFGAQLDVHDPDGRQARDVGAFTRLDVLIATGVDPEFMGDTGFLSDPSVLSSG